MRAEFDRLQGARHAAMPFTGGEWRAEGAEVWRKRKRLFCTEDAGLASYLCTLHNSFVPYTNLMLEVIKKQEDCERD